MMRKFLLFTVLILCSPLLHAQELVDLTYTGESDAESKTLAQKQVLDKAIEDLSLQHIKEMIGEEKLKKNVDLVKNKILRDSGLNFTIADGMKDGAQKVVALAGGPR